MTKEDSSVSEVENSNQEYLIEDDDAEQAVKIAKKRGQEKEDVYRKENRYRFLPFACLILIGGFFNNTFQAFIKDQFIDSMRMTTEQYNLFVLIPPLPNIVLPIFSGQIYDYLGLRKGIALFTTMILLGMVLCFISTYNYSVLLMIVGKTIHQIGNELMCIGQSAMVSVWFDSQTLAYAFTWASLVAKLSGSSSGLAYPQLYNINDDLQIPLLVSIITCVISFVCMIFLVYYDAQADKKLGVYDLPRKKIVITKKLFTDFKPIFFMYVGQAAFLYGSFYAFESYLHSILVHKFGMDSTTAGSLTSIPFWMAFTAPIFGILVDRKGKRIIGLLMTGVVAIVSVSIMLVMPDDTSMVLLFIPLVAFGFFLSMMAAYLFPTVPLLVRPDQVRIGFGYAYASKNAGLSAFGYIGGLVLGSHNEHSNSYLMFFIGIFICSCIFQLYIYRVDAKEGGNINSRKPVGQAKALILSAKLSLGGSIA